MKRNRIISLALLAVLAAVSAHAQTTTPVEVVQGATATATTIWTAVAGLSATAFVFAMLIGYARKGKK